jgi:hypothetical protein
MTALDSGGGCTGRMRKLDPRLIIPCLGLLSGLMMFGYIALWIGAVIFAPD